jgi:hypothetical protein
VRLANSNANELPTACRLQIGDTADYKSALRLRSFDALVTSPHFSIQVQ